VIDAIYRAQVGSEVRENRLHPLTILNRDVASVVEKLTNDLWLDLNIWLPPPPDAPVSMQEVAEAARTPLIRAMRTYCSKNRGTIYLSNPSGKPAGTLNKVLASVFKNDVPSCVRAVSTSLLRTTDSWQIPNIGSGGSHVAVAVLKKQWCNLPESSITRRSLSVAEVTQAQKVGLVVDETTKSDPSMQVVEVDLSLDSFDKYGSLTYGAAGSALSLCQAITDAPIAAANIYVIAMQDQRTDVHSLPTGENVPGYFLGILAIRTLEKEFQGK
jgi:hypothetical protein